MAEETGLVVPLGCWVLEEASRRAREWQEEDRRPSDQTPATVCVNLSAKQFEHPELVRSVVRVLKETGLPPGSLILEIIESAVMEAAPLATGVMRELKTLGVRLAIDDFGPGYSSLSYLKRFLADYLNNEIFAGASCALDQDVSSAGARSRNP